MRRLKGFPEVVDLAVEDFRRPVVDQVLER
jgi:hypothetical protein